MREEPHSDSGDANPLEDAEDEAHGKPACHCILLTVSGLVISRFPSHGQGSITFGAQNNSAWLP